MSKKRIIIISVIILVVLVAALALVLTDGSFFAQLNKNGNQIDNSNSQQNNLPETSPKGFEPIEGETAITPAEQTVKNLARNFAERYGSYSSDANFQNLKELKPLVTDSFAVELDEVIAGGQSDGYYGVSSRTLKVDVISLNDDTASVEIIMQRNEQQGSGQSFVYNQQLNLELINAAGTWLVSQAEWQ